jgi:fructosamine-3-kinase
MGELVRIFYLKKKGFGTFATIFAVVIERLLDSILITFLFAVYFIQIGHDFESFLLISLVVTLGLLTFLFFIVRPHKKKLSILHIFSEDFQMRLNNLVFQVFLGISKFRINILSILALSFLINVCIFISVFFFSRSLEVDASKVSQIIIFNLPNSISAAARDLSVISGQSGLSILYLAIPILILVLPSAREFKTGRPDISKHEVDNIRKMIIPESRTPNNVEYIKQAVSSIAAAGIKGLSNIQMETLRGEKLVEVLQGGASGDQVYLIDKGGQSFVRKSAAKSRSEFLAEQNKWLLSFSDLVPTVKAFPIVQTQNAAYYDLEYLGSESSFFDYLHTSNPENCKNMLNILLQNLKVSSVTNSTESMQGDYGTLYKPKILRAYEIIQKSNLIDFMTHPREHEGRYLHNAGYNQILEFLSNQQLPNHQNWRMHGDLTVSNMLVEDGVIKLIDPNPIQPFHHPTVDFGKLLQSFRSGYEFGFKKPKFIGVGTQRKVLSTRSLVYAEMEEYLYNWIKVNTKDEDLYHAHIQLLLHLIRIVPYVENSEQLLWVLSQIRICFTEIAIE